jgi:hypothetical protein
MHTAEPEILSGTTASEIVLLGSRKRNEPNPRTGIPLATFILAQPCDVMEAELKSTTL